MQNLCIVGSSRDYSDLSSLKHRYMTEFSLHCQQHLLFPTKGMEKWSQKSACVIFCRLHHLYPLAWWYFSFCDPDPLCTVEMSEFVFVLREFPCGVQATPLTELIGFAIWSIFATSRGSFLTDPEHTGGTRCRTASQWSVSHMHSAWEGKKLFQGLYCTCWKINSGGLWTEIDGNLLR